MSPRRFDSFALVTLFLIAAGWSPLTLAAAPASQPIQSKLLDPKPTKDDKSGLQINLPKGWVLKTDSDDTGFESQTKDQTGNTTLAPNVILKAADAQNVKPADVDEIIQGKRKQYAKIFTGYKDVDSAPKAKTIAGKGVGVIEYTYVPKPGITIHGRQIWIVGEGRLYIVTWTSLDAAYPKNQKVFDAAMNTLVVP